MAARRVICHAMHEHELAAASAALANAEVTASFVLGDIDDSEIGGLEAQGLVVQVLEDVSAAALETPGRVARSMTLGLRREPVMAGAEEAGVDVDVVELEDFAGEAPDPGQAIDNFYLLTLNGPLLEPWREQLDAAGIALLARVPPRSYTCYLTAAQLGDVQGLDFVTGVRAYRSADAGPIAAPQAPPPPPVAGGRGRAILTYDLRLHRPEDVQVVQGWLAQERVEVAGASRRKIRVYALEGSDFPSRAATLPEVAAVEQYVAPELHNDVARQLLGVEAANGGPAPSPFVEDGASQIVGVADTGLDDSHPDFQGRILGLIALGRDGDSSDPHGHGTHVAGSILGDGSASAGQLRGIAPAAQLFFQSLLDGAGRLGGLPIDLADLFDEAYQAGARVHNNSWGAATASMYTINSIEVDEYVHAHRDMLIVISAGNEGQAAQRLHSQPGFVDWLSIGSPASSKNSLCVGASRSGRTDGGLAAQTWNDVWPADFPDAPISDQSISGDPESLAGFSSRGPCDDRRIKPDVVAPGTDIASTKSSRAALSRFWGAYPGNPRYAFMGGTSMAAPLVSGCAALVRQHYVDGGHDPSAALLRGTIINGTRWLGGDDSIADHGMTPNYHQGFGCVDMTRTIPNDARPELKLAFADTWQEPQRQLASSGARFRFFVEAESGEELRVCLAYTDLPGRALQNNLNLMVEEPSGNKLLGNADVPMALRIPDPDNNVEIVRVAQPDGRYLIQVNATNLLSGPQDFALIVSGKLTSDLIDAG